MTAGTTYIVSYRAPQGGYSLTSSGLAGPVESAPLRTLATGGVYTYGSGAPTTTSTNNYWVDVVFLATDAAPAIASTAPADGATNVNIGATVSGTFAGPIQADSAKLVVKTSTGAVVDGTVGRYPLDTDGHLHPGPPWVPERYTRRPSVGPPRSRVRR